MCTSAAHLPCTRVPRVPKNDINDSFEADDVRRSLRALKELSSFCCTPEAVKSFEEFAQEIEAKYEREFAAKQPAPFYTHFSESKARLFSTGCRPKMLGIDNTIAAATMRMINTNPKPKAFMTRSKTTGDMGNITTKSINSTGKKDAKFGWRRSSYLKAQEEVLAGETGGLSGERRGRGMGPAQRNARRSNVGSDTATSPEAAAQGKMPRKSSGSSGGTGAGTSGEMLRRVFTGSVRSVRRIGRSFTGLSGSGDA